MKALGIAPLTVVLATLLWGCSNSAEDARKLTEATATPVAGQSTASAATQEPTAQPSTATPSPTSTPTPIPGEIKLLESGFVSYTSSLSGYTIPWAAVIQNTSAVQQAYDTKVTALFYDANNVLLKSSDEYLAAIFPGQVVAAGDEFLSGLPSVPARMEVRISGTKWQTGKTTASLTVSDAALVADRYSPKITAKVTSPFNMDMTNLQTVCIASSGDKYFAVGTSYLNLLPAATTAVADCTIDSRLNVPPGATVRLFVVLTSISSVGE